MTYEDVGGWGGTAGIRCADDCSKARGHRGNHIRHTFDRVPQAGTCPYYMSYFSLRRVCTLDKGHDERHVTVLLNNRVEAR